ncbi:MAG: hypothetical protein MJ240_01705 [Kiritimatiellae bacterium]|nr:hypothetical protein [Kiritimatiellia bacterium]
MKHMMTLFTVGFAIMPLFAETVTIPSGDVAALIAALKAKNGGPHVIQLEKGDYVLPVTPESDWLNETIGYSSLMVNKVRLCGLGESPEDVKLIGNGNNRVIYGLGNAIVENLLITNGYAKGYNGETNSKRGGGCYGSFMLTNCVVTGCRSEGPGGGCQNSTKIWNSRIVNNHSENVGGGFHNCSAYNSLIAGNTSEAEGAGMYTCPRLENCQVIGNVITGQSKVGGGCYNVTYATNCLIAFNMALHSGGGVANGTSADGTANSYYDCTIVSNQAPVTGGGAYKVSLFGCTVADNEAASYGGLSTGYAYDTRFVRNAANNGGGGGVGGSTISNCVVFANICSNLSNTAYGGGINACTAYDCEIYGNYARTCKGTDGKDKVGCAGGVHSSTLYDCHVHDNYADSYGGGIRASEAYRCVIANNCGGDDGANAYASQFHSCEVSGSGVSGCGARDTVFHDIGEVALKGNPFLPDLVFTNNYVWKGCLNATNCLFRNNLLRSDADCTFCVGNSKADQAACAVNCTIVSNKYATLVNVLRMTNAPQSFVNCVFYGNSKNDGTGSDIALASASSSSRCDIGALFFDACAYGTAKVSQGIENFVSPGSALYQFGADGFGAEPGFALSRDAVHPYALRHSSPLLGRGRVMDWMVSATDLRGEGFARLRNGQVDLGCYQCWATPDGTVILFR